MDYVFSQPRSLSFSDCDRDNELKLSTYLAWTSEIAGYQMDYRGVPRRSLLEQGQVFLLAKSSVRMLKPAQYLQNCTLRTWEHKVQGVQFIRHYSLEDENGEPVIQSVSSWFLADPVSRKILRPSEYIHDVLLHDEPVAAELKRLKLSDFPKTAEHTVLLTELDNNQHMNNRYYGDLLVNYAPKELFGRPLASADIAYVHEAYLGETISIHTAQISEDTYAMYGELANGKRCFDAQAQVK